MEKDSKQKSVWRTPIILIGTVIVVAVSRLEQRVVSRTETQNKREAARRSPWLNVRMRRGADMCMSVTFLVIQGSRPSGRFKSSKSKLFFNII